MRARATALGGELTAGRTDDGWFEVHARLPVAATAVATPTSAAATPAAATTAPTATTDEPQERP
jgi:hypothetical protein